MSGCISLELYIRWAFQYMSDSVSEDRGAATANDEPEPPLLEGWLSKLKHKQMVSTAIC